MAQIGAPGQAMVQPQGLDQQFRAGDTYKLRDNVIVKEGNLSKIGNFFKSLTASGRAEIAEKNQAVLNALLGTTPENLPQNFLANLRTANASLDNSLGNNAGKMISGAALQDVADRLNDQLYNINRSFARCNLAFEQEPNVTQGENIILSALSSVIDGEGKQMYLTPTQIDSFASGVAVRAFATNNNQPIDFSSVNNLLTDLRAGVVRAGGSQSTASVKSTIVMCEAIITKLHALHAVQNPTMTQQGAEGLNLPQPTSGERMAHLRGIINGSDAARAKAAVYDRAQITGVTIGFQNQVREYVASRDFNTETNFFREDTPIQATFRKILGEVAQSDLDTFEMVGRQGSHFSRTISESLRQYRSLDEIGKEGFLLELRQKIDASPFNDLKELLSSSFRTAQGAIIENVNSDQRIADDDKAIVIAQRSKQLASAMFMGFTAIDDNPTGFLTTMFITLAPEIIKEPQLLGVKELLESLMDFRTA